MKKRYAKRVLVAALTIVSLLSMFTLVAAAAISPDVTHLPGTDEYEYTMAQELTKSFPFADSQDLIEGTLQIHFWAGHGFSAPGVSCTANGFDKMPVPGKINMKLWGKFVMTDGTIYNNTVDGTGEVYLNLQSALWKYPQGTWHYAIATNEGADSASGAVFGVGE